VLMNHTFSSSPISWYVGLPLRMNLNAIGSNSPIEPSTLLFGHASLATDQTPLASLTCPCSDHH
jgi:hypothetical protein